MLNWLLSQREQQAQPSQPQGGYGRGFLSSGGNRGTSQPGNNPLDWLVQRGFGMLDPGTMLGNASHQMRQIPNMFNRRKEDIQLNNMPSYREVSGYNPPTDNNRYTDLDPEGRSMGVSRYR